MLETEREKYIWLAALIDGEGSILVSIDNTKKDVRKYSLSIRPTIRISMTDENIIKFLANTFEGTYRMDKRWNKDKSKQYKDVYTWSLRGFSQTKEILRQIEPFLIVKKEKAKILNEFYIFYQSLINAPLVDPRTNREWVTRKRLANKDTQLLLKFLIENWFKRFYDENHTSYQIATRLLSV